MVKPIEELRGRLGRIIRRARLTFTRGPPIESFQRDELALSAALDELSALARAHVPGRDEGSNV